MSTKFNPQQEEAIHALGENVIVSASAGAGKTTVLIARLMKRIMQDGVRIDEICAMTFTEAAASEMKTRLLEALNTELASNQSDFLNEQIALVETASISTIHSFCLNIIKNYAYVIGMNPLRTENILSPAEASLMQKKAMELTLNQSILQDFTLSKDLLNTFSSNPLNKEALERTIFNLSAWILDKKNPHHAIETTLSLYNARTLNDWPHLYQELFFDYHREKLSEIYESMMTLSQLTPQEEAFEASLTAILDAIGNIHILIEMTHANDLNFHTQVLEALNIKTKAFTKDEDYTNARKDLESLITTYVDAYDTLDHHFKLMNQQSDRLKALFEMALQFNENLRKLKEDANVLDFSDFETLALEILSANDYAVSKLIKQQYLEVMVDEFQDTNEYQDEIIRLISNGHNIFRVGDIKQSIYGFRGAKPQIMQTLIDRKEGKNLFLSFNYRSKEAIVQYNNDVFDKLMNLTRSNAYDASDHVNVGIAKQSENSHPVELHIIERFDNKDIPSQARQSAQHIAQEILRHHKHGMSFRDMVVLVRSHGSKDFLKEAFEKAHIPHFLNELSGFYHSEIITQSIHLLNYALSRSNYDLAYVLTSLYFGMSEDRIAELSLFNKNLKEALQALEPEINQALEQLIQNWHSQDIVTSISQMIAFNDTYNKTLSIQDKTNLDFLLDKAVLYQSTSMPTLFGFVQFIDEFRDEKSSEASPLSSDADVVSAMTIHQSKGLQFPLVFLFGMGSHTVMNHRNTLITDEFGIGLNHVDLAYRETKKNLLRNLLEFKQDHDEIEEVLRLLYVALTRAQDRLIIVDAIKEIKKQPLTTRLLRNHSRKIDLLLAASPDTTIIKAIDSYEIGDDVLSGSVKHLNESFGFSEIPDFPPMNIPVFKNESLDISKTATLAMAYGTTIHEAIETLPHRLWHTDDLSSYDPSIQSRLLSYNHNQLTQELYKNYTVYNEMSYLVNVDGTVENGIMDCVALNDTDLVLVDFKTDNASEEEIRSRYSDQIERYKKALSIIYPNHSLRAYIYSFHLNDHLSF